MRRHTARVVARESRSSEAAQDPPISECCVPAPGVVVVDPEGNVVQAWVMDGDDYEWPSIPHGIFVDLKIWILERDGLEVVGHFGQGGYQVGQFVRPHNIATDAAGNIYTSEADMQRV